jgi:hypothetical protein
MGVGIPRCHLTPDFWTSQAWRVLRFIQQIGCELVLHVLPVVHPKSVAVVISRAPTVSTRDAVAHVHRSSP